MSDYVYNYYLKDLKVSDKNTITTTLRDLSSRRKTIVEDHVNNYKNVIALKMVNDMNDVKRELEEVKNKFQFFNDELDKYLVNKEMRFDVNCLPDAVAFHRTLFKFVPDEELEEIVRKHHEKFVAKEKAKAAAEEESQRD